VLANRCSPRRVRCPRTRARAWEDLAPGGVAKGKVAPQIANKISPQIANKISPQIANKISPQIANKISPRTDAVLAATLRIKVREEAAAGPSAGKGREEPRRRRAIAGAPVWADAEAAGVSAVVVAEEEVGVGAAAVVVAAEEVGVGAAAVVEVGARRRWFTDDGNCP
jgi:hypothetical protein